MAVSPSFHHQFANLLYSSAELVLLPGRANGETGATIWPCRLAESKNFVRGCAQLPVSLRLWQSGWLRRKARQPIAASLLKLEMFPVALGDFQCSQLSNQ